VNRRNAAHCFWQNKAIGNGGARFGKTNPVQIPAISGNGAKLSFAFGIDPAFELAQGKFLDHPHASLAVVEAGNDRKILAAVALERAGIFDRVITTRFLTLFLETTS
jgi:hypothetical protein